MLCCLPVQSRRSSRAGNAHLPVCLGLPGRERALHSRVGFFFSLHFWFGRGEIKGVCSVYLRNNKAERQRVAFNTISVAQEDQCLVLKGGMVGGLMVLHELPQALIESRHRRAMAGCGYGQLEG